MSDSRDAKTTNSDEKPIQPRKQTSWFAYTRRWGMRAIGFLITCVLCFVVAAWILGNTPVNRNFQHADAKDGINILVINNGVHVDLVLPIDEPTFRWIDRFQTTDFPAFEQRYHYAVFGWGNRQFYMETETWDDLKISNVLFALAGLGETVVHVDLCSDLIWSPERSRKIRLSPDQFKRLCAYLLSSFQKQADDGSLIPIPKAHYRTTDAFYAGTGHYNLFRTCNVWAGSGLAKAGVRIGYWTLTPGLLFACLPKPPPESPSSISLF